MLTVLIPVSGLARQKTDLIFLSNGDRVTGEIKQLDRGILQVKTDNIGTLNIEWEDVDSLNSVYQFRVESAFGQKYFGALFLHRDGTMEVIQSGRAETLHYQLVVAITPLEASFWQRLDGSISIGFSYTKANSLAQMNSDLNIRYRTPLRQLVLDASNIATSQSNEATQKREDISLTYNRLFPGRWFLTTGAGAQGNDELGLDLRLNYSAGAGLNLIRSNHNEMVSAAGLSVNREWSKNNNGGYNLEAFLSLEHSVFRYDYPKTDITAQVTVYPNLTTWGRVRSEIDISFSREIVKDLTLVFTFYDSFDNQPLGANAEKNDYGLVTSLGWTF
ncbi:MAG TPA: DUF481 domain-containing protein [Candidatus Krumholzibacteria bacterium]|nr:DUF481 domain-containing protein [Candidatus Krumholzibacteria bacterium]